MRLHTWTRLLLVLLCAWSSQIGVAHAYDWDFLDKLSGPGRYQGYGIAWRFACGASAPADLHARLVAFQRAGLAPGRLGEFLGLDVGPLAANPAGEGALPTSALDAARLLDTAEFSGSERNSGSWQFLRPWGRASGLIVNRSTAHEPPLEFAPAEPLPQGQAQNARVSVLAGQDQGANSGVLVPGNARDWFRWLQHAECDADAADKYLTLSYHRQGSVTNTLFEDEESSGHQVFIHEVRVLYSHRIFKFLDLSAGAGLARFNGDDFNTFTRVLLVPFSLDFAPVAIWGNERSQWRRGFRLNFSLSDYLGGFDANDFCAPDRCTGADPTYRERFEIVPRISVVLDPMAFLK
ncbi:MAG: hypothetical protein HOP14_09000 [Acidobacteria bacterium]|nr:hypothetical protein [Acidobacteriota bacterium]